MSALIGCQHHGDRVLVHHDFHWNLCGCDGTVHLACNPTPAPSGTTRPAEWPIFRAWRTD